MKKLALTILSALLVVNVTLVRADEGMWLLMLLNKNMEQMHKQGLKLTAEDIYNVNNSSLKDAIIGLGNAGSPFWHFCTGEIVSGEGLVFTNHHCGYGSIQEHSSVEHDYLTNGFWAYDKSQELPNEGMTASILVRMEDVTDQVLKELNSGMSEAERAKAIEKISNQLSEEAVKETNYHAYVADVFNGNQFFLFVYIIYEDVRLVGAPPSSMGKFGGDTDNWMWPRHTDDFSVMRIYTAPDGSPAPYAKENVPLKPRHFLPVSIKGVQDGDFAMVMGFPGTTDRYVTSYGLEETMQVNNRLRHDIRDVKLNVWKAEMAADPKVRIQYASKYASCANYWKYSDEQNKALTALRTMEVKKQIEADYTAWTKGKDPRYAEALPAIEKAYKARREYAEAFQYVYEGLLTGPELPLFAYQCSSLKAVLQNGNSDQVARIAEAVKARGKEFYKDFNLETDRKTMVALFEYVYKNMDSKYYPDFFATVEKKYKGSFEKYVDAMLKNTIFASEEKLNAFCENPNLKTLDKDMGMQTGLSIIRTYRDLYKARQDASKDLERGDRLFVDGLLQMNPDKLMAPDANSTIRLTSGNVKSYIPRDAVSYSYYTTIEGVMEKEDPNNPEFEVPARLKELYQAKNYGQYANEKGELVTCFITDNDITGGNSGSPVINANGELIGLAFDGNSEAMSGDIDFEENLQRCICVDVRYVLFTIDIYAGAKNLIKEMNIVK
ncbi:MAG: S46 family peptidase [Bacteroidales bacterium]|nr:S46 family peptidase [Bacteroidales bacterium]